jgi:hypothetical protein
MNEHAPNAQDAARPQSEQMATLIHPIRDAASDNVALAHAIRTNGHAPFAQDEFRPRFEQMATLIHPIRAAASDNVALAHAIRTICTRRSLRMRISAG